MSKNFYAIVAVIGFMIAFGSVGTLDIDPQASLVKMVMLAFAGLGLMYAGVQGIKKA